MVIMGKKKYAAYVNAVTKEEYGLKNLLPIGFAFMELIHYPYSSALDRKLRNQLKELYEKEYVEFYLRVRWAMAVVNVVIGLLLAALLFFASGDVLVFSIGIGLSAAMGYVVFYKLSKEIEERHRDITLDLPDFTNKLLILSGAGLSLKAAIIKVSREMDKDTPFYNALRHAVYLMENGSTDEEAMDYLAMKCNIAEVRRLCSVILQNIRRGGQEVFFALREIGNELWNARRAETKQMAAEAETKMMFPMMLMFVAVILMVAMPAVMAMGS